MPTLKLGCAAGTKRRPCGKDCKHYVGKHVLSCAQACNEPKTIALAAQLMQPSQPSPPSQAKRSSRFPGICWLLAASCAAAAATHLLAASTGTHTKPNNQTAPVAVKVFCWRLRLFTLGHSANLGTSCCGQQRRPLPRHAPGIAMLLAARVAAVLGSQDIWPCGWQTFLGLPGEPASELGLLLRQRSGLCSLGLRALRWLGLGPRPQALGLRAYAYALRQCLRLHPTLITCWAGPTWGLRLARV